MKQKIKYFSILIQNQKKFAYIEEKLIKIYKSIDSLTNS